jgi:hypothetical protein
VGTPVASSALRRDNSWFARRPSSRWKATNQMKTATIQTNRGTIKIEVFDD